LQNRPKIELFVPLWSQSHNCNYLQALRPLSWPTIARILDESSASLNLSPWPRSHFYGPSLVSHTPQTMSFDAYSQHTAPSNHCDDQRALVPLRPLIWPTNVRLQTKSGALPYLGSLAHARLQRPPAKKPKLYRCCFLLANNIHSSSTPTTVWEPWRPFHGLQFSNSSQIQSPPPTT